MVTIFYMLSKLLLLLFPPSEDEKMLDGLDNLSPSIHIVNTVRNIKVLTCSMYTEPHVNIAIKLLKRYGYIKAAKRLRSEEHTSELQSH